jgi:hypothetical protein
MPFNNPTMVLANQMYPNKKPANYSFEREKSRYHYATFHNEIHP